MGGFSLQKLWHSKTGSLAASGSDNSFTSFPVWQDTKHPRHPYELVQSVDLSPAGGSGLGGKENVSPLAGREGSKLTFEDASLRHQRSLRFHQQMTQKRCPNMPTTNAVDVAESNEIKPIRRGLRRTLSKVKSMTDVQWERAPRTSEGGPFAHPSLDNQRTAHPAFSPPPAAPAKQHAKHHSSGLGTFIKRKMSVDSLVSLRFREPRDKASCRSPTMGVGSTSLSLSSSRSFRDIGKVEDRESVASPRSIQFPGSPMSTLDGNHVGSPCLAGIEEEIDGFGERKSVVVGAMEPIGLGLMFDQVGGSRQMEPSFRA